MYVVIRVSDGHMLPPVFFKRWQAEQHKLGMELASRSEYIILSYIDKRPRERYYENDICR